MERDIRVLHVINQLSGRAGAEVSLRDYVLASHGHGVTHAIAVLSSDNNVLEPFRDAGVPVAVPPRPLGSWRERVAHVRATARATQPALLHTSLFDADVAGRLAASLDRRAVLTSLVNMPYGPEARPLSLVARSKRQTVRLVDRVLGRTATTAFHAISDAAAVHASRYLGVAPQRIRVVPRGRPRAQLGEPSLERRQRVREALGWGERPIALNVARQEPQTGHELLVRAWEQVRRQVPNAQLVLAGRQGRSTASLQRTIDARGLRDSVVELGVRTDVADLLVAADVFVFSSLYEGLGGAVVEAAALEVPVVSFRLPPIVEVLGPDHPGLVEPGDVGALATAVLSVFADREQAAVVARDARRRFDAHYELTPVTQQWTRMYHDLLDEVATDRSRRLARVPRLQSWP